MREVDYERKDYKRLAKEFSCHLRFGKWGVTFLSKDLSGRKLVKLTPLDGWVTDPQEVERLIRENGMEL